MIPKQIVKDLIDHYVYIYIKDINKEFAGVIKSITETDILILEDKNNNQSYISLDDILVITDRK